MPDLAVAAPRARIPPLDLVIGVVTVRISGPRDAPESELLFNALDARLTLGVATQPIVPTALPTL